MTFIRDLFLNDKNILLLIAFNTLIIFLQGFPFHIIGEDWHYIFMLIDDVISLLFVIEIIIKGKHYGLKEYLSSGWNKFDVALIVLSLPPLILRVLPVAGAANISFLLVFRVFRVFKFFRFIHFFPQVEHIFKSIQNAIRASFMVFLGFFLFIFIMSILSCYFYQNIDPEHFGDPIVSYYSMFKVFTVEGWNNIPDEMVAGGKLGLIGAFFTKFYFIIILVGGGIIGLSIVNSIFVDAMVSDNNNELEQQVAHIEQEIVSVQEKVDVILTLLDHQKSKNTDPE
ncbi:MAG: ion transporter [Saprospiraceae bacterium]|nr:ion transporter [Saprospiraceae bacterium]